MPQIRRTKWGWHAIYRAAVTVTLDHVIEMQILDLQFQEQLVPFLVEASRRHSPTMFKATTTSALAHLSRPSYVRALSRSWTKRSPPRIADCTVRYGHQLGLKRVH
jgi:hypothetical protein